MGETEVVILSTMKAMNEIVKDLNLDNPRIAGNNKNAWVTHLTAHCFQT